MKRADKREEPSGGIDVDSDLAGEAIEQATERVKVCVVKSRDTLTEEEVIEHCRKSLAAYKVPKVVQFYPELPKTNVGKILRRELR